MPSLADWLSATPVPMREQKAWIYEQALQSILQLSGCSLAKALAAAALADDRDHQLRLDRSAGQSVGMSGRCPICSSTRVPRASHRPGDLTAGESG